MCSVRSTRRAYDNNRAAGVSAFKCRLAQVIPVRKKDGAAGEGLCSPTHRQKGAPSLPDGTALPPHSAESLRSESVSPKEDFHLSDYSRFQARHPALPSAVL